MNMIPGSQEPLHTCFPKGGWAKSVSRPPPFRDTKSQVLPFPGQVNHRLERTQTSTPPEPPETTKPAGLRWLAVEWVPKQQGKAGAPNLVEFLTVFLLGVNEHQIGNGASQKKNELSSTPISISPFRYKKQAIGQLAWCGLPHPASKEPGFLYPQTNPNPSRGA